MAPPTPTSALDAMIARYERRLETVRRIRDLVADDPGLVADLIASLSAKGNGQVLKSRRSEPTHFESIKQYFEGRANRWVDAPTIMRATGLKRGAIGHVLYKTHRECFEQKAHPSNGKLKLWRLKGGEVCEKMSSG